MNVFSCLGVLACSSFSLFAADGCHRTPADSTQATLAQPQRSAPAAASVGLVGFDRNDYPGDSRLAELHRHFAFTGFWLTPPPGETANGWKGKRQAVRDAGFGFLLLANGRLDAQILAAQNGAAHETPQALGKADGEAAAASARDEGFPAGATIFFDQEEGGRLLPEQAAYFFGWTEAVAASAYKPGAYLSGQRDPDGTGPDGKPVFITTAQDVQDQVTRKHLHPVAFWVYNDACPPAPGCTAAPPPLNGQHEISGVDAVVWQYAQSPRRPELTASCGSTYAADGQCYGDASKDLSLDLNVADSADPSHGR